MNSRPVLVLTACLSVLVIALSFYAWQLRKNAVSEASSPALQIVTPPGNGEPKQVTLSVAHDDSGVLRNPTSTLRSPPVTPLASSLRNSLSFPLSRHCR